MTQRDEFLNGKFGVYGTPETIIETGSPWPKMDYRTIVTKHRTNKYMYFLYEDVYSTTKYRIVLRIAHADGSARVFDYTTQFAGLGRSDNVNYAEVKFINDGDELILTAIAENRANSTTYAYTAWVARFTENNTIEYNQYSLNGIYAKWTSVVIRPYLDNVTGNIVYKMTKTDSTSFNSTTKIASIGSTRRNIILNRNSSTVNNVILHTGVKTYDFPDDSGLSLTITAMEPYLAKNGYVEGAQWILPFLYNQVPLIKNTTTGITYIQGSIDIYEPITDTLIYQFLIPESDTYTIASPQIHRSWLPPQDAEDQFRRGKFFIVLSKNYRTTGTGTAYEFNVLVSDSNNVVRMVQCQIPFINNTDKSGIHTRILSVDNADNVYVIEDRRTKAGTWYTSTYHIVKYSSAGVKLWERHEQKLDDYESLSTHQPMFFNNQNTLLLGGSNVPMMIDTTTGAELFDIPDSIWPGGSGLRFTDSRTLAFMDVYDEAAGVWEPRFLTEDLVQSAASLQEPFKWIPAMLADYVSTTNFVLKDTAGNLSPVSVTYSVQNTTVTSPYRYVEDFTLKVTINKLGYRIVGGNNINISMNPDETITNTIIVIEPLDFETRTTYYVSTPQDVINIRNDNIGNYIQVNDIDMQGIVYTTPFSNDEYNPFLGDYDGAGYEISNLNITRDGSSWLGIGFLSNCRNSILRNMNFKNCTVNGTDVTGPVGMLAGQISQASLPNSLIRPILIENCFIEDCTITTTTNLGAGIAVGKFSAIAENSLNPINGLVIKSSTINALSGRFIGGAIGSFSIDQGFEDTTMYLNKIYAETTFNLTTGQSYRLLGGLFGYMNANYNAVMDSITCKTTISTGDYHTIGLFGETYVYGEFLDLNNVGVDIEILGSATSKIGGITGYLCLSTNYAPGDFRINNVYTALQSPSVATSADVLIGELYKNANEQVIISNVYHNSQLNTFANLYSSASRTTEQMYQQSNYINWDFNDTWNIRENVDYPQFLFSKDPPTSIDLEFVEDIISIQDLTIRLGSFKRLKALANFADGSTLDVSASVSIIADIPNLVEITKNKIEALGTGVVQMEVTYNRYTELISVNLYGPEFLTVESPGLKVNVNKKLRLNAKAYYIDDYIEDCSLLSNWVTSDPTIMSVTTDGIMQGLKPGFVRISADYFGAISYVDLEVINNVVVSNSSLEILNIDKEAATTNIYFTLINPSSSTTYFRAAAYLEETQDTEIAYTDILTKPENFAITLDSGVSWNQLPAEGLIPTNEGTELYRAKLNVGPRNKIWISASVASLEGEDETEYFDDVTAPIINVTPSGGKYSADQYVTILVDEEATIYYTLDETAPTKNSAIYTAPIVITTDTTIKCFAVDIFGNPTYIQTKKYEFNRVLPVVSSKLASGTYMGVQEVKLITSKGNIYYTVDGTIPTISSIMYTAPIMIPEDATTELKFLAIDAYGNASEIITMTYVVTLLPAGSAFGKPILLTAPGSVAAVANSAMRDVYFLVSGLTIGTTYIIDTVNPDEANTYVDSRLWIYNTSRVEMSYDDDAAPTQGLSQITFTASETSIYAMVDDYSDDDDIVFELRITAV